MTVEWECKNCLKRVVTASMYDNCPECDKRNAKKEALRSDGHGETFAAPRPPSNINRILDERGEKYGDVGEQSETLDRLLWTMQTSIGSHWRSKLDCRQRQSLTVIALKISRILHGDPDYDDNWDDIAGYALLGKKR